MLLRLSLLILMLLLLGGIGGFIYLGARPPQPHIHTVDKTLNNDQFQTH